MVRLCIAIVFACFFSLAGCDEGIPDNRPIILPVVHRHGCAEAVSLPVQFRQSNWGPSCMVASTCTMLKRLGRHDVAAKLRARRYGRHSIDALESLMAANGLPSKKSYRFDASLLDWCSRTGRYAVVCDAPDHARTFAGWDRDRVYIIDSNDPKHRTLVYDRHEWMRDRWNGWAIACTAPVAASATN